MPATRKDYGNTAMHFISGASKTDGKNSRQKLPSKTAVKNSRLKQPSKNDGQNSRLNDATEAMPTMTAATATVAQSIRKPELKNCRVEFKLRPSTLDRLRQIAEASGVSMNEAVHQLIIGAGAAVSTGTVDDTSPEDYDAE